MSTNRKSKKPNIAASASKPAASCAAHESGETASPNKSAYSLFEHELDNLSKVDSLLACLTIALEYEGDAADKAYYPDVTRVARTLLRNSLRELDSEELRRLLLIDRVKEAPHAPAMTLLSWDRGMRGPSAPAFAATSAKSLRTTALSYRLHRRPYGLAAVRKASMAASASMKSAG